MAQNNPTDIYETIREDQKADYKAERVERLRRENPTHPVFAKKNDPVDNPAHYTHYVGLEIIDLTEQLNFNRGNVVKYVARAGVKDTATEVEDLRKAAWYLGREIRRIQNV